VSERPQTGFFSAVPQGVAPHSAPLPFAAGRHSRRSPLLYSLAGNREIFSLVRRRHLLGRPPCPIPSPLCLCPRPRHASLVPPRTAGGGPCLSTHLVRAPPGASAVPASPLMSLVSGHHLAVSSLVPTFPAPAAHHQRGERCPLYLKPPLPLPFPICPIRSPLFPRPLSLRGTRDARRRGVVCAPPAGRITPANARAACRRCLPRFTAPAWRLFPAAGCHSPGSLPCLGLTLAPACDAAVPSSGDVAPGQPRLTPPVAFLPSSGGGGEAPRRALLSLHDLAYACPARHDPTTPLYRSARSRPTSALLSCRAPPSTCPPVRLCSLSFLFACFVFVPPVCGPTPNRL
jgi:hypothetical protein